MREKAIGVPLVNDPTWEVVPGGIGLSIEMEGVPPFMIRLSSSEGFKAFMNSAMDAAIDAWPDVAHDWENIKDVHGEIAKTCSHVNRSATGAACLDCGAPLCAAKSKSSAILRDAPYVCTLLRGHQGECFAETRTGKHWWKT